MSEASISKKKFVFLVGQTASGKSQWSLDWAKKFEAAIFNCDSIQAYQHVDVGSAKPNLGERKEAPHYLYDYVSIGQSLTAGQYRRDFFAQLNSCENENIIVVGGTGFYFQALEKGMYEIPEASSDIKAEIEKKLSGEEGVRELYAELQERDPAAAQKIHLNDVFRIGRAIEVIRSTGMPLSRYQQQFGHGHSFPYPLLKIGIRWGKEKLLERITERTRQMLKLGLVEETQRILESANRDWSPMQSVGYKQVIQYLDGELSENELESVIVQATWQLAKKQKTWFQRDSEIHWFEGTEGLVEATKLVANFFHHD